MTLTYRDLTSAQRRSLDCLPFDGNHLVSGPPGSGKSLLAAQRAVLLALTGTPVVLLTRSNLLRQSLTPMVRALGPDDDSIRVATAHSWLAEWYGSGVPKSPDGWYDWPAFYARAAETGPLAGLTLVIDEGQDLPPEFYRLCLMLGARTTVYADECQRLTETHSSLEEISRRLGGPVRTRLDGNHRNSRQIAFFAAHFHTSCEPPSLPEADGPPPTLHRLTPGNTTELIIGLAERRPQHTIGVIVNSAQTQFDLLVRLERRAPHLKPQLYTSQATQGRYRTIDLARPGIVILHRASAKGLGFDTVVVPDTHTDAALDPTAATLRMTYYVLATRARKELHLGYEGDVEPPLLAGVDTALLVRD
ncbi:DNA helicase [Streptomyces sp. KL116D]|uniref:DNA helicase n=1 Tax=Streptomyces sp. KL116D TaxID=3045152 RepID=UPI0035564CAD